MAVGVFFAFSNGKVYVEIIEEILNRLIPKAMKWIKPKDFTEEQLKKIRQGENPFDDKPPGAGR